MKRSPSPLSRLTIALILSVGLLTIAGRLAAVVGPGPLCGAWLLRRVPGFRHDLARLRDLLAIIVLGGLASVSGALYGAFLLTLLQNLLTRLPIVSEFKNLYIVVLGLILILTILFFPRGIAGAVGDLRRRTAKRAPAVPAPVRLPESATGSQP